MAVLTATVIIICCYSRIFLAVLQQKRQIAAIQVTNGNTRSHHVNLEVAADQGSVLEAMRSAKKIFIITLVYFVAYFPSLVATVTIGKTDISFYASLTYFYLLWLQVSNGFFNSLVYIMLNTSMKQALVDMFKRRPMTPEARE